MPETIGLKVVALISGGKDSIFSILHCQAQRHDVVALANLHPPVPQDRSEQELGTATGAGRSIDVRAAGSNVSSERTSVHDASSADVEEKSAEETDLDSYMYQTVGHSVVPLFPSMLGLPLYRRAIRGTAQDASREYAPIASDTDSASASLDETEDLFPLLREVMIAHPEVNGVSTGAILSNYQRTRVESIALRLGLTPLSYLWQYPYLPPYNDLSLLRDMQTVHLDARIIKVASGGLDERILWQSVSQQGGWTKVRKAMYRFAASSMPGSEAKLEVGAVLGEGGEFETLVVNGPAPLFKGEMVHSDTVTSYGEGGSASMILKNASVKTKTTGSEIGITSLRVPPLFDDEFKQLLQDVHTHSDGGCQTIERQFSTSVLPAALKNDSLMERCESRLGDILVLSNLTSTEHPDVGAQLKAVLNNLAGSLLSMEAVVHTTLLLRRMEDFAIVNKVYSNCFAFTLPPSRVTVSCGDTLPAGVNIALSVTAHRPSNVQIGRGKLLPQPQRRSGLHVQSRSYWAPANIGPYSQARAVSCQDFGSRARFDSSTDSTSITEPEEHTRMETATEVKQQKLRIVYIAGQIPLVPSSMQMASSQDLPRDLQLEAGGSKLDDSEIDVSFKVQAILALQHLCRVARATNVRFFTPTVAMLSRSTTNGQGQRRARIAGHAWQSMHHIALQKWNEKHGAQTDLHDSNKDDGTEDEVDLWDLRNRMDRHSLAFQQNDTGDDNTRDGLEVPDFSMLQEVTDKGGEHTVPSMFTVEVQQLPRDAAVEWCSAGIAIPEGADKTRYRKSISCKYEGRRCCVAVSLEAGLLAEAIKESDDIGSRSSPELIFSAYALELRTVETTQHIDGEDFFARLTTYSQDPARKIPDGILTLYVSSQWHPNDQERTVLEQCRAQLVPCFNVWDDKGAALACLAVEQTVEYS